MGVNVLIGICEDNVNDYHRVLNICEKYYFRKNEHVKYLYFDSGEKLLEYDGDKIALLFLDIELGGINGVEIMKEITVRKSVWRIVFMSAHEKFVWDAFSVRTLGFMRKPVNEKAVCHWLDVLGHEYTKNKIILFDETDANHIIAVEELVYLEAQANYVSVKTIDKQFLEPGNLKYWEKTINCNNLVRIHKSFLVNMDYIDKITDHIFLQKKFGNLPIGRKYKSQVNSIYSGYLIDKIRERV